MANNKDAWKRLSERALELWAASEKPGDLDTLFYVVFALFLGHEINRHEGDVRDATLDVHALAAKAGLSGRKIINAARDFGRFEC